MGPKERLFKPEYAPELLSIAENDLKAAKTLAGNPEVRSETVLLLVQQAIEKALKSVLCLLRKPIPMTHDLYLLVDRLGSENAPPHGVDVDDLTPYATIRRYEEGRFEITQEDLDVAFQVASDVLIWSRNQVFANVES